MQYEERILLKDGRTCLIRSACGEDAQAVRDSFQRTHAQTDFLLSYPDEDSFSVEQERQFLTEKEQSGTETELCAIVDGRVAGTAGIEAVGRKDKVKHRAEFGISVEQEFWGLGIGRALTQSCIDCARRAGYAQLELQVVSDNLRALALYRSAGFREYGRNPRGFRTRAGVWQELLLLCLELN